MRFEGICYRAHDPRWSFLPLSGDGAALRGARFNPKGVPALYLGLTILTAIKEANQGFAHRIDPCVLCAYEVDCTDIADLSSEEARAGHGVTLEDMACPWALSLSEGRRPASWTIFERLSASGTAGILVPSFAPGADAANRNLVLWNWGPDLPHRVSVIDPLHRLPHDQASWQ